jgi:predicted neuraminidase
VLMFMRTNMGRIFQSISQDGGEIWEQSRPTELPSGDVPCCLARLRSTGDLLVIWNQASTQEIQRGYSRGRLSVAVSRNEGKTWDNFRTIERSEGLEPTERIDPPPVHHVRASEELGTLPDNYAQYHYPSLAFVQGKVLLIYNSSRVEDAGSGGPWNPKVKVVEETWFYS